MSGGEGRADAAATTADAPEGLVDIEQVRREIEEEVRRHAASDLPPQVERELDELFLRHAPHGNRGAGLRDLLRQVDAAVFIDPMVPVASRRPGGAAVKRGLRSLSLWYLRYVTYQVSAFATAVSRALHVVDLQLTDLRRQMDALTPPAPAVVETGADRSPAAWWVPAVVEEVAGRPGRVLHTACGDGWLVGLLAARGVDAYGVDPRPGAVLGHELDQPDLREEEVGAHLEAVGPGALGAVVLTGVVDGAPPGQRQRLLEGAVRCLAAGGVLVVHSLSPAGWDAPDAPVETDLVTGRPLRPTTWPRVLEDLGLEGAVRVSPDGAAYLVTARPRVVAP